MLSGLELILAVMLLVGLYFLATGKAGKMASVALKSVDQIEDRIEQATGQATEPESKEVTSSTDIYMHDRPMSEMIHTGPQNHFGNLDGNLGDGGIYGDVQYNNRFTCQGCGDCAPATYKNDVDERFEKEGLLQQLRQTRTDEYPFYQLN